MSYLPSPFYPEGGGQVGDGGTLTGKDQRIKIYSTKKENNEILHFAHDIDQVSKLTEPFIAEVAERDRWNTASNHTATHLLHQALREVLGTHVEQRGSSVHPEGLRFDFSHFAKLTAEELNQVEELVNERIREGLSLEENRSLPLEEALAQGAMALFGEKYGDSVRTIRFGESIELCGGTHVKSTSDLWHFKIVSEGGVAAGIRRIEAITSDKVKAFYQKNEERLEELQQRFPKSQDLVKSVDDLLGQLAELKEERDALVAEKIKHIKAAIEIKLEDKNGLKFAALEVDLDAAAMKQISFDLATKHTGLILILGSQWDAKAALSIYFDKNWVSQTGNHAGKLIRELGTYISGGGGGQDFFATAGGKNPAGIPNAIEAAKNWYKAL